MAQYGVTVFRDDPEPSVLGSARTEASVYLGASGHLRAHSLQRLGQIHTIHLESQQRAVIQSSVPVSSAAHILTPGSGSPLWQAPVGRRGGLFTRASMQGCVGVLVRIFLRAIMMRAPRQPEH
jgi:hypothetical protein